MVATSLSFSATPSAQKTWESQQQQKTKIEPHLPPVAAPAVQLPPRIDVGAASNHNQAVHQKWAGFNGSSKDVASANPHHLESKERAALYDNLSKATTSNVGAAANEAGGVKRAIRPFREVDVDKLHAALPPQAKHLAGSFVEEARKNGIDPVVLAAISKHETANFTSSAFRNKHNAMGICDKHGPTMQKSAEDSIGKMARGLGNPEGYYRNKDTIGEVANTYAPKGARNDPNGLNNHWGKGVAKYADDFAAKILP